MTEPTSSNPLAPLRVDAVLRTDVGRVRTENQDFGAISSTDEERGEGHPGGRLLIVADGMGGHRGGATASRVATETIKAQYLGSETGDVAVALTEALTRANARVFSEAAANPDLRGMGTTTSALVVRGREAWFAHVGDSRIYMVRDDAIEQLTEDHSLVASMVREGLLTAKEAETHPRRNVLQRSVGVSEEVEVDVRGPIEIRDGDTFILCSDGLHGLVKEDEIRVIAAKSIDEAADEFIRLALERGAPDNVTVIVARAVPGTGEDSLPDRTLTNRDSELYDETIRDAKTVSTRELPASVSGGPSDAAPEAKPTARRPVMKWMLVVVMFLGAAAMWLHWTP